MTLCKTKLTTIAFVWGAMAACAQEGARVDEAGDDARNDTSQTAGTPSEALPADPAELADTAASDSLFADSLATDSLAGEIPEASLPAGTLIPALNDLEISTRDHREGAPVIVSVAEDIANAGGVVLIPRGSKLLGRVTFAASSSGPGDEPVLEVAFETVSAETTSVICRLSWSIRTLLRPKNARLRG